MMIPALEQLTLLLTFIVIGYIFGKTGLVDRGQTRILSVLCVNLFLPCTIFNSFSKSFTVANLRQYWQLILGSFVILLILLVMGYFLSRALSRDEYQRKVIFYSLVAPSYGYTGYAVAEGLFGSEGLLHLILFAIPVSLFIYTVGFSMLTRRPLSFKKLFNSVNLAIVPGILFGLTGWRLPGTVSLILSKSAGCMAPVCMLLTGLVISEFQWKQLALRWSTAVICLMRLLVIPVAVALVLRLTGNEILTRTAVLMYAMPCGLNTILFPKLVGEDCSTGATLALISNVLALVTIPFCLSLV